MGMRHIALTSVGLLASLLMGCSSARAAPPPRHASEGRGPYQEESVPKEQRAQLSLVREDGSELNTYWKHGRRYVLGEVGERYSIRVRNLSHRRIETVVSVDGLDVVDGETASLSKRGYIVPGNGEVLIEGFRVSLEQVASFRFSSVASSYAGRKGQARNVGVIGLAVFDEFRQPVPRPRPNLKLPPVSRRSDDKSSRDELGESSAGSAGRSPAPASPSGPALRNSAESESDMAPQRERRGLGTEFGEARDSGVELTSFRRKNARRPQTLVSLRYNDADGLETLGIQVYPRPRYDADVDLRETADPFPHRFAKPPR